MEKTALDFLTEHYAKRMNTWRKRLGKRRKKYSKDDFILSCIKDYAKKYNVPEDILTKLEEEWNA